MNDRINCTLISYTLINYTLAKERIPIASYNLMADLPSPCAQLGTRQSIGLDGCARLRETLVMQVVLRRRTIRDPKPVHEIDQQWQPSPQYGARTRRTLRIGAVC